MLPFVVASFAVPSSPARAQEEDDWDDVDDGDGAAATPDATDDDDDAVARRDDVVDDTDAAPSDVGDDTERAPTPAHPETDDERWVRRFRAHPTVLGASGGFHVQDAASGPIHTLRLQLETEHMVTSDFLESDDTQTRVGGSLSISWTVHELVELFAAVSSWAATNDRGDPKILLTLADTMVGAKVFAGVRRWLSLGGSFGLVVPTSGELGPSPSALGFDLRALATIDLQGLRNPVPFIARFNLGYVFDNSAELVADLEQRRLDALPPDMRIDGPHYVTAIERFGLGINRSDRLRLQIGFEVPLRAAEGFYVSPVLEWTWAVPLNRRGFECPFFPAEMGSDTPRAGDDSCLDRAGLGAFPMQLTLGVRVLPPVRGLAAMLGVDIGLTGTGGADSVRELAATAPWTLMVGVSYAFDLREPPPPVIVTRQVDRRVEVREPPPVVGRVNGLVVENETNVPLALSIVRYPGRELTAQSADEHGRFTSYALPPGEVHMEVEAAGHEPGSCAATIPERGGDVEVRCALAARLVIVEEQQVVVLEQIQFAFDSDEILAASFPLMENIARVLNENPQLARIEIQGHTDDVGTDAHNDDLSNRRASSVMRWLVEHGVAQGRLTSHGYGERVPLVPNTDDASRARNRRVQFIIQEHADDAPPGAGGAAGTP